MYVAQKFSNLRLALSLIYQAVFLYTSTEFSRWSHRILFTWGPKKGLWILFGGHFRHYVAIQMEPSLNREERIFNFTTTQTKSAVLVKDIWNPTAAGDSVLLGKLITSHASRKSIKKSNLQNRLSYTHYLSINILRAISN